MSEELRPHVKSTNAYNAMLPMLLIRNHYKIQKFKYIELLYLSIDPGQLGSRCFSKLHLTNQRVDQFHLQATEFWQIL